MNKQEQEAEWDRWMLKLSLVNRLLWRAVVRPMLIFLFLLIVFLVVSNYYNLHT